MTELVAIAGFEVGYYLKRISTWVYFLLFFGMAFLVVNVAGGAFGTSLGNEKEFINSPSAVAGVLGLFGIFQLLVTAAIFGHSAHRDYEVGIHPLFFTAPISKAAYLGGRFVGAAALNLFIALGSGLGFLFATWMPYLNVEQFGPFRAVAYVQPYLLFVIPNLLFAGAIFFALAVTTRQMLANYVGSVVLMVGYFASSQFLSDLEHRTLGALLDPFGFSALEEATRYWTVAEKNTLLLPVTSELLLNRLLWVSVAVLIFGAASRYFRFSHAVPERRARATAARAETPRTAVVRHLSLPPVSRSFGARTKWVQLAAQTRNEFSGIVSNLYFRAILLIGLVFLCVSAYNLGKIYGTTTYPVTYIVLDSLGSSFGLLVMILITFQAGELIWRDRQERISGITDSMPIPTWIWFASKLGALVGAVLAILALCLVFGLLSQVARGYYNFELSLYLRELFVFSVVSFTLWSVFALTIHAAANHKYVGHVLVIAFFIGIGYLSFLGFEHSIYRFDSGGMGMYSDMNGYGYGLGPYVWHKLYWGACAVLLAVLSNLLWVRGSEADWRQRLRVAQTRFAGPIRRLAALGSLAFIGLGGFVYYNTNMLNEYTTSKQERRLHAEYEKRYKRYESAPQPRIAAVNVHVDMHPEDGRLYLAGTYRLVNRTSVPIDSLHVLIPDPDLRVAQLDFDREATAVLTDAEIGYRILRLSQPLAAGDSLLMRFDLRSEPRGFTSGGGINSLVRKNGTFIGSASVMPAIGYSDRGELVSDRDRKREGLQPKDRLPSPHDEAARRNNDISHDADWIDFRATLGTSADQIAVAPGYLKREWTENGRRYFEYETDAPTLNFYAFLSARYRVRHGRWQGSDGRDVAIEVYYHPGHEYNLERMIRSVKQSLSYYTEQFGPYQHRQVRILEFPRYRTFAQSFANTIPYSESFGFIARVNDAKDDIDYPFYVTAHEVAHQWWGHQVIGANAQGSPVLMESLSEYSALMVMEKEFGPRRMRKFLEHLRDEYLMQRTMESKRETPLLYAEGQQYVHYQKGGMAFYALRDYIGEEALNRAIRDYTDRVKFQGAPYTTSLELYDHLRRATPDSLHAVLADLFERITIHENRATEARVLKLPHGRYQVDVKVFAKKVYADSLGTQNEAPVDEWIDIGVFAQPEEGKHETSRPLHLRKHKLRSGEQTIRVVVDGVPGWAGVDPMLKLMDRDKKDNLVRVRLE
jgi:ABC-2 type transport system permease protein